MDITDLLAALNHLELSNVLIYDRSIDGCHAELSPDGSGSVYIELNAAVSEFLAHSPISAVRLAFRDIDELDELCCCMKQDTAAIVTRAEQEIDVQIAKRAERL